MKCREFRDRYNFILDAEPPHIVTGGLLEHLHSCEKCRRYAQEMAEIDAALRRLPDVTLPEGLESTLEAIPAICEREGLLHTGRDDFRRTAIYLVPAVALAVAAFFLIPEAQPVILTAVAAMAFVAIAFQHMRRSSRTV